MGLVVLENVIEICNVTKRFGGVIALNNVSLTVKKGEIIGVIGPNGSGKTTLFNCISGVYKLDGGSIRLEGKEIHKLRPYQIAKWVGRTFQIPQPFKSLTVLENVMVATKGDRKRALECLDIVGLKGYANVLFKNLNFSQLRLLELARALALMPKVLLIDEIAAGLNPKEAVDIVKTIKSIQSEYNIAIMWVEHVMRVIMRVADKIVVLNRGMKIAEGSPTEVANNEEVIEVYLGKNL